MPGIDATRAFVPLTIAVVTVSDTRTLADDRAGDVLVERLTAAGHRLGARAIVRDDRDAIIDAVRTALADHAIDVILTTGGTGFTGRDVTPEAIEPLFDKRMDGFFRRVPPAVLRHDRDLDDPVARDGGPRRDHIRVRAARFARSLPRRLGRHPRPPARLPLPTLQLRGTDAAARRASAATQGVGLGRCRDGIALRHQPDETACDVQPDQNPLMRMPLLGRRPPVTAPSRRAKPSCACR